MQTSSARRLAAIFGFLAVALGAFGAHALRTRLEAAGAGATWQTAVFYHLTHAIMLYVVASGARVARFPFWAFVTGITLFSGSLYLYALTKLKFLVFITPVGGAFLLAGWLCLALRKE